MYVGLIDWAWEEVDVAAARLYLNEPLIGFANGCMPHARKLSRLGIFSQIPGVGSLVDRGRL